jgi:transposase-like protein
MRSLATYPASKPEFNRIFATEADCLNYVATLRWPQGFRCARCGHKEAWLTAESLWKCKQCGHRQSPTAGTLLHRTRYPLKTWLEVAWHVCEQKNGVSALGLQRAMNFGSYHTAWEWLHRMRRAMVLPNRSQLNGEVEVDETFIGGVKPGKRGRGAAGKALVMIAAEVRGSAIGRIRLRVIPDATANTLLDATQELVEPGSNVITDGLSSYAGLAQHGYNHTVSRHAPEIGKNLLPKAHRVASLLKRWILGTHQGSTSQHLLSYYLDEFVFRFNRRSSKSRGLLFSRLVERVLTHPPIPKKNIAPHEHNDPLSAHRRRMREGRPRLRAGFNCAGGFSGLPPLRPPSTDARYTIQSVHALP